jgi:hypothetical protein
MNNTVMAIAEKLILGTCNVSLPRSRCLQRAHLMSTKFDTLGVCIWNIQLSEELEKVDEKLKAAEIALENKVQ